jgi:predicted transcriptional regulator of viral defense system
MNRLELLKKLQELDSAAYPAKTIALMAGSNSPAILVHRLTRAGILCKLKNGLYAQSGEAPEAVATSILRPAYISFLYALSLHGVSSQNPIQIQVASLKWSRPVDFAGFQIVFVKTPARAFTDFSPVVRGTKRYFLASPEKALADCIARPETAGMDNIREAWGLLSKRADFDANKVRALLAAYRNKRALARFDKLRGDMDG